MTTPDDSPIGGADAAELTLKGRVGCTVSHGEPRWKVDGTIFDPLMGLQMRNRPFQRGISNAAQPRKLIFTPDTQ